MTRTRKAIAAILVTTVVLLGVSAYGAAGSTARAGNPRTGMFGQPLDCFPGYRPTVHDEGCVIWTEECPHRRYGPIVGRFIELGSVAVQAVDRVF